MWGASRFRQDLDKFLARYPEFIALDLPLPVAMAVIRDSDLFLGVDSCMLHAADFFRLPGKSAFSDPQILTSSDFDLPSTAMCTDAVACVRSG
jgi:hypothetical protein